MYIDLDLCSKIPSCLLATIIFDHEVLLSFLANITFIIRRAITLCKDSILLWIGRLLHKKHLLFGINCHWLLLALASSLVFTAFLLLLLGLHWLSDLLIRITIYSHD